jgi:hypothetical protein
LSFLSAACLVLFASAASAQDAGPTPEQQQKYMELATPGPHHKMLAASAGTWDTKTKEYMQPGAPPTESTGTSKIESVMGGRFIEEVTTGTMMGMPWEGRGVFGYDNATQKHIGTWYDSWGTTQMAFQGTCSNSCKNVTMTSTYFDTVMKMEKKMKVVSKQTDNDHSTVEIFEVAKDGKENRLLEIQYTRSKTQATR